jgi:hypothetical protein
MVRTEFGKVVIVAIPGTIGQIPTSALPGDQYVRIKAINLRRSQLPAILKDKHGTITKPASW